MTTKERDAIQKFFNQISVFENREHEVFGMLQEASRRNGLPAWCCAEQNYIQLQDTPDKKFATWKYEEYLELGAKIKLMEDLGRVLCGIDFWKERKQG